MVKLAVCVINLALLVMCHVPVVEFLELSFHSTLLLTRKNKGR